MIEQLLIGTSNPKKVEFYRRLLADLPIKLLTLKDFEVPAPDETGATVEENAILKADYYFEKTGLPTLADDGGFEVLALNNWPGTHAHRFTDGHLMSDEEVIAGVIERMKDLKGDDRKARFHVVLALRLSKDELYIASGEILGHVPEQPLDRRMPHFAFRSLLFVDQLNKWFMDVTDSEEEPLGYRKAAIEQLKVHLKG